MTPERMKQLLEQVAIGKKTPEQAIEILKLLPFEDLGFAKVDHHRTLRRGFPEVVFGVGKNPEDIAAIAERLSSTGQTVLVTKTTETAFKSVSNRISN